MEESEGAGRSLGGTRIPKRFLTLNLLGVSALLFTHLTGFDIFYALTIWPAWLWLVGAMWLGLIGVRKRRWYFSVGALAVWMLAVLSLDSEARGLLRTLRPAPEYDAKGITIVTLNCAGGRVEAAREALDYGADIVLLQESPSRPELEKLIEGRPDYQLVSGPDASILVLGTVTPIELTRRTSNFVCGRARLKMHELDVFVVSLRLQPPVLRFDYWNPACWSDYAESKERRREELTGILHFIESQAANGIVVIGGDFNTPPDRSIQRALAQSYTDTFADSGRGFGATAVVGLPLVRIDQIWFRGPLWTWNAGARKSAHSDHLMAHASLLTKNQDSSYR